MFDTGGRFSEQDLALAKGWVESKAGACSFCGAKSWDLSPTAQALSVIGRDSILPVVTVICKECGLVVPLSAAVVGVLKGTDSPLTF